MKLQRNSLRILVMSLFEDEKSCYSPEDVFWTAIMYTGRHEFLPSFEVVQICLQWLEQGQQI